MAVIKPIYKWNSAQRPIIFGIEHTEAYAWQYPSVQNEGGKARFTFGAFNPYGTPPCRFMFITSGIYQGFHAVVEIKASGDILTNTPYIGTASGTNARLLVNLNYEIYTGYPSVSFKTTVNPFWKNKGNSAELVVDISPFIHAQFKSPINAPNAGVEANMFTHFRVKIVAGTDFKEHLLSYSLNPDVFIQTMTGHVWNANTNLWYALNSSIRTADLQAYTNGQAILSPQVIQPVFGSVSIFSKIVVDKVENIII